MTEGMSGWGEFQQAIDNLEAAAGGGSGMPRLRYQDRFLGKQGFAWDAQGNPVDAIDETYMAAYWADNRAGIGAVPFYEGIWAD